MTVRIIRSGTRVKPTKGSVPYTTADGKFFVRKADLKEQGCKEAPVELFQIITDELPEGWEVVLAEQEEFSFEL